MKSGAFMSSISLHEQIYKYIKCIRLIFIMYIKHAIYTWIVTNDGENYNNS